MHSEHFQTDSLACSTGGGVLVENLGEVVTAVLLEYIDDVAMVTAGLSGMAGVDAKQDGKNRRGVFTEKRSYVSPGCIYPDVFWRSHPVHEQI